MNFITKLINKLKDFFLNQFYFKVSNILHTYSSIIHKLVKKKYKFIRKYKFDKDYDVKIFFLKILNKLYNKFSSNYNKYLAIKSAVILNYIIKENFYKKIFKKSYIYKNIVNLNFLLILIFFYFVLLINYTLKFENTLLILFFLVFVVLIYLNIYNFLLNYLNKLSFNIYINFKENIKIKKNKLKLYLNNYYKFKKKVKINVKSNIKKIIKIIILNNILFKNYNDVLFNYYINLQLNNLILNQNKLC